MSLDSYEWVLFQKYFMILNKRMKIYGCARPTQEYRKTDTNKYIIFFLLSNDPRVHAIQPCNMGV